MSGVRALAAQDIVDIASMFQRVFRKSTQAAPASLVDYIRHFYFDAPGIDDGIHSLVHVDDAGTVSGFIGVHALPMTCEGLPLRAAICGSLMVTDPEKDPLAGARLLKAFLDGPQDLSFSESANDISNRLWTRLGGAVLTQNSLDWIRVIQPAGFVLDVGANRIPFANALRAITRGVDTIWRKRLNPKKLNWSAVPVGGTGPKALETREIGGAQFTALLPAFTTDYVLKPDWDAWWLDRVLADAADKPELGPLVLAAATTRSGMEVGAFAYYAKAGAIGRVLQLIAKPGQVGAVIDCLIDHAAARGLSGLRGRLQPSFLDPMILRRIVFMPSGATVVHSRDAALLKAAVAGPAFLNGLAGEEWSRLIGGTFI